MDDTRIEFSHRDHYFNRQNELISDASSESEEKEPDAEALKRKAEAAKDMMSKLNKGMNSIAMEGIEDGKSISDMTNMLLSLAQEDNKPKRKGKGKQKRPCELDGSKDLCDGQTCLKDGGCRSGCCSQVLTKGYKRCSPMLVGDYCPRALDPVFLLKDAFLDEVDEVLSKAEKEIEDLQTKTLQPEKESEKGPKKSEGREEESESESSEPEQEEKETK